MKLRPTRILAALTFGLALTLLLPGYAGGQPTTDIHAKAAQLEKDLNTANQKVETLGVQLQAAQAKVDEAETRVKVAQDGMNRIKSIINERAATIYKRAGTAGPFDALNAQDAQDLTTRSKYTDLANGNDQSLVQELAAQRSEFDKARADAASERDGVAAAKTDAESAASEQQKLLDQVKGDIEAELRSQTASRAVSSVRTSGPPPVGSGGAGAAAAFAQAQVGKPYCNTGARFGPDCFDCSGLTTSSWRAGGMDIPTVSGAQGSAFPHVDLGSLQPGDLITTSSWSAHVGIWVGGGYVHATSYSNNPNAVRFVGGTSSVVDAVRPS